MAKIKAIRSGFFNAIKNEDTNLWDRVYTEEDMTDYFRGVIRQTGIFSEIGKQLRITKSSGYYQVNVGTGKAMVNGHWGIITSTESITLAAPDIASWRRDYISIRWTESTREITLEYVKGTGDLLKKPENYNRDKGFDPDRPLPYGKLEVDESKNRDSFEPVEYNNDYICEMILAYIDIPPGDANISTVKLTDLVGTHYAPYITNLVFEPTEHDVNTYMANLRTQFVEWFNALRSELVINTNIETIRYVLSAGAYTTVHLKNIAGYHYEDGDTILPFYNGLLLTRDKGEYSLNTSNKNDVILTLNNGKSKIPADNVLEIVILKGTPLEFDTGDTILY